MIEASSADKRTARKMPRNMRRWCSCGCKRRATHIGMANGVALVDGCELFVRRWVRSPREAFETEARLKDRPVEE